MSAVLNAVEEPWRCALNFEFTIYTQGKLIERGFWQESQNPRFCLVGVSVLVFRVRHEIIPPDTVLSIYAERVGVFSLAISEVCAKPKYLVRISDLRLHDFRFANKCGICDWKLGFGLE